MPCFCCPEPEIDDVESTSVEDDSSSVKNTVIKKPGGAHPAPEAMQRGAEGGKREAGDADSDYRAVAWIRSRSAGSNSQKQQQQHVELSPAALNAWQQQAASPSTPPPPPRNKHMATLESVEIDDLSRYPTSSNQGRTVSTDSSDVHPSPSRTSRLLEDCDELDAIMLELEGGGTGRSRQISPSIVTPSSSAFSEAETERASTSRRRTPPAIAPSDSRGESFKRKGPTYTMDARPVSYDSQSPRRSPNSSRRMFSNRSQTSPDSLDSLSDVPSYVDPDIRDRYLKACRLLKLTLIERESALLPSEKEFLQGLLEASEQTQFDEQLSAIETASQTLLSDPLFQVGSVTSSNFDVGGFSSAKPAWQERAIMKDRESLTRLSDKSIRAHNIRGMPALVDEEVLTDTGVSAVSVARFDGRDFPFYILGVTPNFKVGVLTPSLMESLRGFFPCPVADENFWLKFSLQRDGASLPSLLSKVRSSKYSILGVETTDGYVFGAFCSTPWRVQSSWFGSGECFLWRLKRPRLMDGTSSRRNFDYDNEMEVYPYTGSDDLIQYCTKKTIAFGGGSWSGGNSCPYPSEPLGIGFMVDGDLMGGETNACATFNNPRLGQRLSKNNEFDIRNLEVWTVTPSTNLNDAEKCEMHRHFVAD